MTVDSQVKNSYFTVQQAAATMKQLRLKTDDNGAKHAFQTAEQLLALVKNDLQEQLIFLAKEEPEYE